MSFPSEDDVSQGETFVLTLKAREDSKRRVTNGKKKGIRYMVCVQYLASIPGRNTHMVNNLGQHRVNTQG